MTKKNYKLGDMRLSKEMNDLLNELAEVLGFRKTDLARFLLNRSLVILKADIKKHGIENLDFSIRNT